MNERIQKILEKSLDLPEGSINEDSNQDNTENWDSIHTLRIIIELEREFKIRIPEESYGNMISYELIKNIVDDCL